MASQEQPLHRSKRCRRSPKSLNEVPVAQGEPVTGAHRSVHTDAPRVKRVQHDSPPTGRMADTTEAPSTSRASTAKSGKRISRAKKTNSDGAPQWLKEGTRQSLTTFSSAQLQTEFVEVTSDTGFELVCTYNWRESSAPSIYVPGAPPSFVSRQCPMSLKRDTGYQFIDQNAFRVPKYPFEPIFQALSVVNPEYNFTSVDLVTNRNSLRKLLDFAEGRARDNFRIDLSIVGETLFLSRHELKTREKLTKHGHAGFGHNFEKAFSEHQESLRDSTGHHRVIKYVLGNLNCVVRYEVDACCDTHGGKPGSNEGEPETSQPLQPDETEILDAFSKLSLSAEATGQPNTGKTPQQNIEVIPGGTMVPTTRTVEVKTRSKPVHFRNIIPQLWFGRTPHLRVGMHTTGKFTHIESIDVAGKFSDWEQKYQIPLRKVVYLLSELKRVTKQSGGNCVAVYNRAIKPPQLEIFAAKDKETLPAAVIEKFWRKE